jgi:peroxiredoxin
MRLLHTIAAACLAFSLTAAGAEIPRKAPELTFTTTTGKTAKVSDFAGKVAVFEILRPTCPHCQNSAKILSKLQTELGPKGFQAIGIGFPGDGDLPSFIRTYGVNFPVGTADRDAVLGFLQHSIMQQSFYFPQMVFVDRNGLIRAQYSGVDPFLNGGNEEANIRTLVQKLLTEGGKAASNTPEKRKGA